MKRPLEIRLACAGGSLGAAIGSIATLLFDGTYYSLAMGTAVGSMIGALIGYRMAESLQTGESVVRARRFVKTSEKIDIFTGWAFVACGVIVLLIGGWDVRIFLATAFFALGSAFLTYYR